MLLTNLVEAGRELPWPTRILKALSDFLVGYGFSLAVLLAVLAIGLVVCFQTQWGRRVWCQVLHKVPLLGNLEKKQTVSRLSMLIAVLLRSGIVLEKALQIASRSTRNVILREALDILREGIRSGEEIGPALEKTGVFPATMIQVFTVGQQSGQLEKMLERLARDYDRQVTTASTRVATAIEPVLIIILGFVVGFILFATVLPILEAGNLL